MDFGKHYELAFTLPSVAAASWPLDDYTEEIDIVIAFDAYIWSFDAVYCQ